MKLVRMLSSDSYKGTRGYLHSQKKYEILRTILYFAISISLFIAGWLTVKSRLNLLTIVAVLGCLPACKSAVGMILYLRAEGCPQEAADNIEQHANTLHELYDMVFTSYEKNYQIYHIVVKGNTICGYTSSPKFDEQGFYKHMEGILRTDHFHDVTLKIFTDLNKYLQRLYQLQELDNANEASEEGIINTLKSVSL